MSDTRDEMIKLIRETHALVISIDRRLASQGAKQAASAPTNEVADDADLDSQYGDEEIKRMPSEKYWQGADFAGSVMSACPADFLDAFAKYKDACAYMNEKSGDEAKAKYIGYDRKSARRARGWSARVKSGKVVQTKRAAHDEEGDSAVPF
jgi:hypothetical protein